MRELTIGEVARWTELRTSALRYYEEQGVLPAPRRENGRRRYDPRIVPMVEVLRFAQRAGFTPEQVISFAAHGEAEAWEGKVLRTYLQGERLSKIPDTRKKRGVVLRWLVTRFEEERRYPEREVNEVIERHHPDFATLRRELVGAGLMQRENGIYWRPPPIAVA